MDRTAFEAGLARDGYTPVSVSMEPNKINAEHLHPFDARLLVLEGSMTVTREDGPTRTYAAGEIFEMPRGTKHAEIAGETGATYLAGRRFPVRDAAQ